jgi:hypothetical protein
VAFWKRKHNDDSVKKRKELNLLLDLWPVAIWQSRYGGTYEGGRWIAIGNCEILPQNTPMMDSDVPCSNFWHSKEADHIGRGATPNEALEDLIRRNQDLAQVVDSFYSVDWDELERNILKNPKPNKKFFWKSPPFR